MGQPQQTDFIAASLAAKVALAVHQGQRIPVQDLGDALYVDPDDIRAFYENLDPDLVFTDDGQIVVDGILLDYGHILNGAAQLALVAAKRIGELTGQPVAQVLTGLIDAADHGRVLARIPA